MDNKITMVNSETSMISPLSALRDPPGLYQMRLPGNRSMLNCAIPFIKIHSEILLKFLNACMEACCSFKEHQ